MLSLPGLLLVWINYTVKSCSGEIQNAGEGTWCCPDVRSRLHMK